MLASSRGKCHECKSPNTRPDSKVGLTFFWGGVGDEGRMRDDAIGQSAEDSRRRKRGTPVLMKMLDEVTHDTWNLI